MSGRLTVVGEFSFDGSEDIFSETDDTDHEANARYDDAEAWHGACAYKIALRDRDDGICALTIIRDTLNRNGDAFKKYLRGGKGESSFPVLSYTGWSAAKANTDIPVYTIMFHKDVKLTRLFFEIAKKQSVGDRTELAKQIERFRAEFSRESDWKFTSRDMVRKALRLDTPAQTEAAGPSRDVSAQRRTGTRKAVEPSRDASAQRRTGTRKAVEPSRDVSAQRRSGTTTRSSTRRRRNAPAAKC